MRVTATPGIPALAEALASAISTWIVCPAADEPTSGAIVTGSPEALASEPAFGFSPSPSGCASGAEPSVTEAWPPGTAFGSD